MGATKIIHFIRLALKNSIAGIAKGKDGNMVLCGSESGY